jgi:hypothetical protein
MCVFCGQEGRGSFGLLFVATVKANDVRTASTYGTLCSKRVAKLVREAHQCPFSPGTGLTLSTPNSLSVI